MNQPITPPKQRTELGEALTAATVEGELVLQQCQHCDSVQYPPREICHHCLSDELTWRNVDPSGKILAAVELHHSYEAFFSAHLPWAVASIQLNCGPIVFAHIEKKTSATGTPVTLFAHTDRSGQSVLIAATEQNSKPDYPALLTRLALN